MPKSELIAQALKFPGVIRLAKPFQALLTTA
jgi:hypothetical protein